MPFTVYFHSDLVLHREQELLTKAQQRAMLVRLESSPETGKPLQRQLRGCYRLRIDDRRVVYRIDRAAGRVEVLAIGMRRRDEAYVGVEDRL